MTPFVRSPPLPITDREVAADHLLEARKACHDVMTSTLPGLPLYEALRRSITALDEALRELAS